jgi:hypothetical protein
MSDEVLSALGDIQRTLGKIDGKLESHIDSFRAHVEDDRKAYAALISLKEGQARQKGFLTAIGMFGSGVGAALGWIIQRTFGHH